MDSDREVKLIYNRLFRLNFSNSPAIAGEAYEITEFTSDVLEVINQDTVQVLTRL